MVNTSTSQPTQQQSCYISGIWSHLFKDDQGERTTRILIDATSQKLIRMDIQANRAINDSFRQASRDEMADVEDSLVNANSELFDMPDDYGLELTNALPEWVTGGFQPKQIAFYKPDPTSMGPIVITEVGTSIQAYCVQRELTLSYYAGDLYTAQELTQELESLIFSPGEVMHRREKIVGRLGALKAAALLLA